MAKILTLTQKRDLYQGLIRTPDLIKEMTDYELAETHQYACQVIEGCKKDLFDLLNRSPRLFEIKKAQAESRGMNESEVYDLMLREDFLFIQASGVRDQIEEIKYLREKQKIDKKHLEISAVSLQDPGEKLSVKKEKRQGSLRRAQAMFYILLETELKRSKVPLPNKYKGKKGIIQFFKDAFPHLTGSISNHLYIKYNEMKNWNQYQMENNQPVDYKQAVEYLKSWDIRKMKWSK